MRDLYFLELRDRWKEIRLLETKMTAEEIKEARSGIYEMVEKLLYFSSLAGEEGLLELESELADTELDESEAYIRNMLTSCIDGYDSESLEELYMMQYFAEDWNPYAAVCYLYFLYGAVTLVNEWSGLVQWAHFCILLPEEMQETCCNISVRDMMEERKRRKSEEMCETDENIGKPQDGRKRTQEFINEKENMKENEAVPETMDGQKNVPEPDKAETLEIADDDPRMELVHRMCEAENPAKHGDTGYVQMRAVDILLAEIGDEGIRKLLPKLDNDEWAEAMMGLSGQRRKEIFSNMPNHVAYQIAISLSKGNPFEVILALKLILSSIKNLVDNGEIVLKDKRFMNLFEYL